LKVAASPKNIQRMWQSHGVLLVIRSRLLQLAHRFCNLPHLGCHGSLPREYGFDLP